MISPPRFTTKDLALIVVFAALTAALGLVPPIPVFGGTVPITAQTLGAMLAGSVLGAWRGAASMLLLLTLVAVGLPLLSGWRGGPGVFVGPTVGYLVGWIVGAFIVGLVVHSRQSRPGWIRTIAGLVFGGMLVLYVIGVPVSAGISGLPLGESIIQSLIFWPVDLVKVAFAATITMSLWKAYPRAFRAGHERRSSDDQSTAVRSEQG